MQPLTHKSHKIPKTLHLSPEYHLHQKILFSHDPNNPRYSSTAAQLSLSKYFPKYYHHLEINHRQLTHPIITKVKRVKTTNHFLCNYNFDLYQQKSLAKLQKSLLQTKRKSLKSLPMLGDRWGSYYRQFTRLSPLFPNIVSIDISRNFPRFHYPQFTLFTPDSLEKSLINFYGYFWGASRKLQHLKISVYNSSFDLILRKLNTSKRFLASLKTFKVSFYLPKEAAKTKLPLILFQVLLNNQNCLKYLTHLSFESFENLHYFGSLIKEILDISPRLISLSFPLDKLFYNSQKQIRHNLTLAPLKSFQNIQNLQLDIWNIVGFLQIFEFPFKLHTLYLDFSSINDFSNIWDIYFPAQDDPIHCKKPKIVSYFFEKFQQLHLLTTLNLTMPEFFTQKDLDKFLLPLIKNIPNLTKFTLKLSQHYFNSRIPLNLSDLLNGITSIKTLKSFEFLYKFKVCETNQGPIISADPRFSFENFTFLKISTRIPEDSHRNFLLQVFNLPQKSSEMKRDFHLGIFSITSAKKFSELIKTLNRVIPEWKMLKVSVEAEFVVDSMEEIERILKYPVQLNNALMVLNIDFKGEILTKEDLQYYKNIFRNFKLNLIHQVSRKDFKCIVKNGIVNNSY